MTNNPTDPTNRPRAYLRASALIVSGMLDKWVSNGSSNAGPNAGRNPDPTLHEPPSSLPYTPNEMGEILERKMTGGIWSADELIDPDLPPVSWTKAKRAMFVMKRMNKLSAPWDRVQVFRVRARAASNNIYTVTIPDSRIGRKFTHDCTCTDFYYAKTKAHAGYMFNAELCKHLIAGYVIIEHHQQRRSSNG